MKLNKINPAHIFSIILLGLCAVFYVRDRIRLNSKLGKCSLYTVAKVTRIKYRKSHAWIVYEYKFKGNAIEKDDPANPGSFDEWLNKDIQELAKRRFWVQMSCEDPNFHKLLWDVAVPDTLQNIPVNGWEKLPFGLKSYNNE
jgi:hypothetical protein